MDKVQLFIVGAPKCGTWTLYTALKAHPLVTMSSPKEPNYFAARQLQNSDDHYYNEKIYASEHEYEACFRGEKKIRGEASVTYFHADETPKNIYAYNPDARIVIITRDPVRRAWSHYLMDRRLGYCDMDLHEILQDPDRYRKYYKQYIELGMYDRYIQRYIDVFGHNKVLLLKLQDLNSQPEATYRKLCDFIGVEYDPVVLNVERENTFLRPRLACIAFLYKSPLLRRLYRGTVPPGLTRYLKRILFTKQGKPAMPAEIEARLRTLYADGTHTNELI